MRGTVLFRYPGESPSIFHCGEGEDQLYLCPFEQKSAALLKGQIGPYEKIDFPLFFTQDEPYCSSKETYLGQFGKFIAAFREQHISKAILSRVLQMEIGQPDVHAIFESMCRLYPTAFCYVLSIDGIGTWAGASPEILMTYSDQKIRTVALAGTKKSADASVWTEKEKVEHRFVEHYIEGLASESHPLREKSDVKIVQAGSVYHLKSTFEFGADVETVQPFLEKIHPTPAICGLPYEKSKALILATETHARSYYCGYIGIVGADEQSMKMYVNIRCMQLIKDRAFLYVGGGITPESKGEDEWNETENKSRTMAAIFGG